jgi:hypothetical protein
MDRAVSVLARATRRRRITPRAVEQAIATAFDFLVADDGFELATSERFDDGASVGYRDRAAGVAVLVRARRTEGVWGGIGSLDADGRLRPLTFETYQLGHWRDIEALGIEYPESDDLFVAILALGASLKKVRPA